MPARTTGKHFLAICAICNVKSSFTYCLLFQEVLVRFVGFDAEGDEWVNVKTDIRERSLPLEDSECGKVKVGDLIVCFQVILWSDVSKVAFPVLLILH